MIRCGRVFAAHAAALAIVAWTAKAACAQGGPVFDLQPGFTVFDFVSVPEGTISYSAFSLRFSTRFPTHSKWLTPIIGASFLPYGTTENSVRNTNAPTLFAGNVFPITDERRTAGWLSMEVPLLVTHSPGGGPTDNPRDYGRDLVILPTVYVHLGARALREFGNIWSRLKLVGQLENNLTPRRNSASGARDFLNPIATIGLSLGVGTSR